MRKTKNTIKLTEVDINEALEYYGIRVIKHTVDDGYTVINEISEENWRVNEAELQSLLVKTGMQYAVSTFRGEVK